MFFSSIKGINRLISKGMSNIYLELTIEKKWFPKLEQKYKLSKNETESKMKNHTHSFTETNLVL